MFLLLLPATWARLVVLMIVALRHFADLLFIYVSRSAMSLAVTLTLETLELFRNRKECLGRDLVEKRSEIGIVYLVDVIVDEKAAQRRVLGRRRQGMGD